MPMKLSDKWEDIPPLVEAIIGARSVTKEKKVKMRGGSISAWETTRPFRFIEFAAEVGLDNGRAHRYIRGGLVPKEPMRKKIYAWCKKHFAAIKTK